MYFLLIPKASLKLDCSYLSLFRVKNEEFKIQPKDHFDIHHKVQSPVDTPNDTEVCINLGSSPGPIFFTARTEHPLSYIVEAKSGMLPLQ